MISAIKPVILCGGSGTRLWPLSREQHPKQLLSICGDESLLQGTARRAALLPGITDIEYICNEQYRFLIAEQVREVSDGEHAIVLEPCGRNTAPAIGLAAFRALEEDAVLLIMPSDHMIADYTGFAAAVASGVALANEGKLVTFGVKADRPETGYGYIQLGEPRADGFDVKQFVEKPDEDAAAGYVASGGYFWNAGIFMFLASTYLAELKKFEPEVYDHCKAAAERTEDDLDFVRVALEHYEGCPVISIDYAVMERTGKAVVVPLDAGWTDVGTFDALWAAVEKDDAGNAVVGDVMHRETFNSYLRAEHRLLTTIGVENLVVIETPDAVLVASKTSSQDVKILVNQLRVEDRSEGQEHRRVYRPWGYYEGIDSEERYQVKMIEVNPEASLSLQMHHHRAEHWIVVTGTARVTKGEDVFQLTENESTYIPIGTTHRLENPGKIPLRIIEVQSGSYLGEDDIVRFEDSYGRNGNPPINRRL